MACENQGYKLPDSERGMGLRSSGNHSSSRTAIGGNFNSNCTSPCQLEKLNWWNSLLIQHELYQSQVTGTDKCFKHGIILLKVLQRSLFQLVENVAIKFEAAKKKKRQELFSHYHQVITEVSLLTRAVLPVKFEQAVNTLSRLRMILHHLWLRRKGGEDTCLAF